jgi:hypothetical protein
LELSLRLSLKLNQSLETIYDLPYLEYSLYLNIVNDDINKDNADIVSVNEVSKNNQGARPLEVSLPSHLKLK